MAFEDEFIEADLMFYDKTKAFTDSPLPTSQGIDGLTGTRNAPTVLNAAYLATQFWDGRSPSLEDQALHPFLNPVEMGLPDHQPIQFTLRGLMIATGMTAITATVARTYAARPETLVAIYVLGPLFLVIIAMLPRQLQWQTRVLIIVPATLTLIAVAIAVGIALGMEFDKVLMGIFLCWTPQSVFAAIALTTLIFAGPWRDARSRVAG